MHKVILSHRVVAVTLVLAAGSLFAGCGGGGGGSSSPVTNNQSINYQGFASNTQNLAVNQVYNWGPAFLGSVCRLTDKGQSEASSVYFKTTQQVTSFTNSFDFQILSGNQGDGNVPGSGNLADGFTFVFQRAGLTALGTAGGNLGYSTMPTPSMAIKFDVVQNGGDPSNSCTGLFMGGASVNGGTDLLPNNINLRSQDHFRVDMTYTVPNLTVTITDLDTHATAQQHYNIDIPATLGASTAFVGFSASTGLGTSATDISRWVYKSP